MKLKNKLALSLIIILFCSLATINFSLAGGLLNQQVGISDASPEIRDNAYHANNNVSVQKIVIRIIVTFLSLLGLILVIIVIYAGFRWMTAGGNEQQVTESKQWLINATIGLLIVLSSYGITKFTANCLVDAATSNSSVWYCPAI